jgi:hypothetical protein
MLRPLQDEYGWYFLDRGALADAVHGEEVWFCCQGVRSLAGSRALRCQAWISLRVGAGEPIVRQQCGRLATLAPDGEALCRSDCFNAWFCSRCEGQFSTKYGGTSSFHGMFCPSCAAEELRCEECGVSCPEQMAQVQDECDPLLCVQCQLAGEEDTR